MLRVLSPAEFSTRGRFRLRGLLAPYPKVFLPMMRRRSAHRAHVVNDKTEIMIEGFPRCGNTFAVAAFELAQGRPVHIARHLHAPAHVIEGVHRGLPIMVVTRQPVDAVTSQVIRHPGLSLIDCLTSYLAFHRRLLPYADRFVVAPFPTVTTDFGSVIDAVNRRFSTDFTPFEHTPDKVAAVFATVEEMDRSDTTRRSGQAIDTVARPVPERDAAKRRLREQFSGPHVSRLIGNATDLYRQFVGEES